MFCFLCVLLDLNLLCHCMDVVAVLSCACPKTYIITEYTTTLHYLNLHYFVPCFTSRLPILNLISKLRLDRAYHCMVTPKLEFSVGISVCVLPDFQLGRCVMHSCGAMMTHLTTRCIACPIGLWCYVVKLDLLCSLAHACCSFVCSRIVCWVSRS